jgi:hypothetical protein
VPGEAIAEAFDAYEKDPSAAGASPLAMAAASRQTIQESMRLVMLVRAYQVNGHFAATLDPLGLEARPAHEELKPETFGFGPAGEGGWSFRAPPLPVLCVCSFALLCDFVLRRPFLASGDMGPADRPPFRPPLAEMSLARGN